MEVAMHRPCPFEMGLSTMLMFLRTNSLSFVRAQLDHGIVC